MAEKKGNDESGAEGQKMITRFQQGVLQTLVGKNISHEDKLKIAETIEAMFFSDKDLLILHKQENFVLIKMDEAFRVVDVASPVYPVPWSYIVGAIEEGKAIAGHTYRVYEMEAMKREQEKKPDIIGPTGQRIN